MEPLYLRLQSAARLAGQAAPLTPVPTVLIGQHGTRAALA